MDFFRAVVLGVLQGLTEFLPISSSAHLAIFPKFFGWDDPGAAYTAVVQIGTELAVLLYFWRDIWTIGSGWVRGVFSREARSEPEWRMGWFIIIGSLPIVALGLLLQDAIDREFRNLWVIGSTLIVLGIVLGIAERIGRKSRPIEDLTMKHAILLGFAQAGALVPGVSRSGATISMGLILGYERAAATRYAFLLAIPAVVGAGIFKLKDIGGDNTYGVGPTIVGTVVSFVVGLAVIHWLLKYVSTHSYTPFVLYRIGLGALVLILVGAGVITAGTTVG
ncbi:undecaprenyl-diphosphate phosphatase [Aeromicrobium wangtongii]|uniref:Undecaprenyl-diphosphatase n=1 Tax=Aeromicrobium wangtongii TaxID=2969247 RepID=A0ABY5M572_9ACTN|nr:undecaprenyl-diphosphate phosphatase [Aeromicrobium wangtongii]MCD9198028.1 undecaprenyl-diphosphate phosphatase [Aeromicrobium wangtongii]MCL3819254.1 undecaprenyl-diphosphate phosphatase [Aeromicrobium wangtongii]UUP12070.1 undecaprenyl-diphosphate phosphatase [Aeromicrobium wangtongii]